MLVSLTSNRILKIRIIIINFLNAKMLKNTLDQSQVL